MLLLLIQASREHPVLCPQHSSLCCDISSLLLESKARQSHRPRGQPLYLFTPGLLLLNIHTVLSSFFFLTGHRNSILKIGCLGYMGQFQVQLVPGAQGIPASTCMSHPWLTAFSARVSEMMASAASVHVPAQRLEPENCSGPEVPAKDDSLRST